MIFPPGSKKSDFLEQLTKVEEDEFGLNGGKHLHDDRYGQVDDHQHKEDPLHFTQQPEPEETSITRGDVRSRAESVRAESGRL